MNNVREEETAVKTAHLDEDAFADLMMGGAPSAKIQGAPGEL